MPVASRPTALPVATRSSAGMVTTSSAGSSMERRGAAPARNGSPAISTPSPDAGGPDAGRSSLLTMPSNPESKVRRPAVAGSFYPARAEALRSAVGRLVAQAAPPRVPGSLRALIAPHAGIRLLRADRRQRPCHAGQGISSPPAHRASRPSALPPVLRTGAPGSQGSRDSARRGADRSPRCIAAGALSAGDSLGPGPPAGTLARGAAAVSPVRAPRRIHRGADGGGPSPAGGGLRGDRVPLELARNAGAGEHRPLALPARERGPAGGHTHDHTHRCQGAREAGCGHGVRLSPAWRPLARREAGEALHRASRSAQLVGHRGRS